MENLEQLAQINWWQVILAIFLFLVCLKFGWSLLDWLFFEKLGIKTRKTRQREQESELLKTTAELAKTTAENLSKLQSRHTKDEEEFRNNLNTYMEESRADRKALHDEMSKFTSNRINDREQSLHIQKDLTDSIKVITEGQESRDKQIEALICGSKELLGDTIDQRYNKYVSLGGIPQNEVDEFDDIFSAYKNLNGNHGRDTKYKYVKEHLPVIPVETKLLIDMK